jgi:hypothetical protein
MIQIHCVGMLGNQIEPFLIAPWKLSGYKVQLACFIRGLSIAELIFVHCHNHNIMASTEACPEKSVLFTELVVESKLSTPDLEHGLPEPIISTRTIHGFKV